MQRIGNLYEKVVSYANLHCAFKKAYRGARRNEEVTRFFFNLEKELLKIKQELVDVSYVPGAYRYFTVHDPKEREIAIAPFRDRVVHHAIVNILEPIYEKRFIYDSYATRKGKGTLAAIKRAQEFMRKNQYYIKLDISKYFSSVDRNILMNILERKIKDRTFLKLVSRIIWNPPEEETGLPIGNMTSQFFANVYLDPFDHFVKEELGCRYYIRYMDDSVIFSQDRDSLKALLTRIRAFLAKNLKLKLNEKAVVLNTTRHGLGFLGVRIFDSVIRIRRKNLARSLRRIGRREKERAVDKITDEELVQSVQSVIAHLSQFNTLTLRRQVFG